MNVMQNFFYISRDSTVIISYKLNTSNICFSSPKILKIGLLNFGFKCEMSVLEFRIQPKN